MQLRKRGADMRTSTPILVLLVGLILILYILFLPPAEREDLLSGAPGGGGIVVPPGGGPIGGGVVIIDKYVGSLHAQGPGAIEHSIPSTTVFTAVNTEEVKFIDSMLVKKGAFSNQEATLSFRADQSVAKNYLLTFNVEDAKGPLQIFLNGYLIFEREITSRSPEPIKLPQEHLQVDNEIMFKSGSAGWTFWEANRYQLRNILVSADVTSYEGSRSEQHFTIPVDEYEQMEKATLQFVPQCDPTQSGRLTITVNGQLLFAGFIDCGVATRQDIAKTVLNAGDNAISFTSSQGSYLLDHIQVTSQLEEGDYPVFYFNLPPDMFEQVNVFAGRIVMTLRFTEGNQAKRGSVIVNGYQDSFQTSSYYYQATLDPNVLIPNANSIQIIPEGAPLHVAQLRVELLG